MAGLFDNMLGGDAAAMQRQLDEQRAAKFAEQTQEQRLAGMSYKAGAGLGRGLAGAFGVDIQDPTIRRAAELRRVAQDYDITSSEGLLKMANAIKEQYPSDAQQLAQQALAMREKESVINKNNREKQAAGLDEKVFAALAAKATPASIKAAQAAGNDISLLVVPENVKVSTYGQVLMDAGFVPGTPSFQKRMQDFAAAELESTRKGKGTSITNVLPGVKEAGDITGLRKDVQAITKPYQDKADAANDAIGLANMAIKTKNFAAAASLARSLSKAAGDQQITAGDVAAFDIDPSLVGTVSDTLARYAKGVATEDTLIKLREVAKVIEAKNKGRIQQEEEQTMNVARASKLFTEDQIQTVFPRRPKDNTAGKTSFNSVAEAEAAKLPKGTIITINGRRARVE